MNPLLPRAIITLAALGVAAVAAWRAAQGPVRGQDDPRYRPHGRFGAGWNPFGDSGLFGGAADPEPPLDARARIRRAELGQLRDALSGAALDPAAENFRCARCQSYYSVASVRALANENGARCISCRSMHRIPVELVD